MAFLTLTSSFIFTQYHFWLHYPKRLQYLDPAVYNPAFSGFKWTHFLKNSVKFPLSDLGGCVEKWAGFELFQALFFHLLHNSLCEHSKTLWTPSRGRQSVPVIPINIPLILSIVRDVLMALTEPMNFPYTYYLYLYIFWYTNMIYAHPETAVSNL